MMAETLVKSFDKQRANLDKVAQEQAAAAEQIHKDREHRSQCATVFSISAALLTVLGVFGNQPFGGSNV
jgi:hypothetical protein